MINECDSTVAEWTPDGDKFVVKDKEVFASKIIPQYYDHNNYSSFTRQLNFYGFTREQSMTIKVSDLSSLAVGQETFYHKDFQRGRPDLLKNLQRRSSGDAKNGKKRKKPKTTDDATLAALQNRLESMEQQSADMLSSMNQLREENYASAAAIRDLQTANTAKDAKIEALEKRLNWLEQKASTSYIHRQDSFAPQGQRLNGEFTRETSVTNTRLFPVEAALTQHTLNSTETLSLPIAGFPGESAPAPVGNATLAPHPRMKRPYYGIQKDAYSIDSTNVAGVPSRETSLDLGLFAGLTRDSTLMSWLPRQDTESTNNNNINV